MALDFHLACHFQLISSNLLIPEQCDQKDSEAESWIIKTCCGQLELLGLRIVNCSSKLFTVDMDNRRGGVGSPYLPLKAIPGLCLHFYTMSWFQTSHGLLLSTLFRLWIIAKTTESLRGHGPTLKNIYPPTHFAQLHKAYFQQLLEIVLVLICRLPHMVLKCHYKSFVHSSFLEAAQKIVLI